jgi:hypothetical protein
VLLKGGTQSILPEVGAGLLKKYLPRVIWPSTYFSGPNKKKSPGAIIRPNPTDPKTNSSDSVRAANCGIELVAGGE